jgi:hypothetical protein
MRQDSLPTLFTSVPLIFFIGILNGQIANITICRLRNIIHQNETIILSEPSVIIIHMITI